ncbi:MAG: prolyl oligopeptidase family serine peptidase [Gemmataceae bacterium]|nr:prolyl oligopeptidase family serine peptidase [Gemmataceae bacterium]
MKLYPAYFLFGWLVLTGCNRPAESTGGPTAGGASAPAARPAPAPTGSPTLAEARKGYRTKLPPQRPADRDPVPDPPPGVFQKVAYESPVGKLAAYLTPDPGDGVRRPAVVWITGGDCNSIGEVWEPAPAENDQSAAQYREAGAVMMFPSLRGGNDNPGVREGYLGEVDDVLAAADFLRKQPHVDPARVYLGGHSTGGTLALLTAECSDAFRAVFAFGPVEDPTGYPPQFAPFDVRDPQEVAVRSPGRWLGSIRSPTFVIEGGMRGNAPSVRAMAADSANPKATFLVVRGADHFSILAPANRVIAQKILTDTGPDCAIALTADELGRAVRGR